MLEVKVKEFDRIVIALAKNGQAIIITIIWCQKEVITVSTRHLAQK